MATAGELKTLVTADTTQFNAGLARAGQQARGFGSGLTTQLQAASAGVQDFAAVLGQGGANSLGRAFMASSNNISQFTASMGPWGAVIGGVAATLASTLVPALLKAAEATKSTKEQLEALAASSKQIGAFQDVGVGLDRQIKALGDGDLKAVDAFGSRLKDQIDDAGREMQRLRKLFDTSGTVIDDFAAAERRIKRSFNTFGSDNPADWAAEKERVEGELQLLRRRQAALFDLPDQQLRERFKGRDIEPLLKIRSQFAEEAKKQQQLQEALGQLPAIRGQIGERLQQDAGLKRMVDDAAAIEKHFARGRDLVRSWETPFERSKAQIEEMAGLLNVGALTRDQFDRGADFLGRQFAPAVDRRNDTGAMSRDSMAAARTILAATRPAVEQQQNAEAEAFKRFAEQQKEAVLELRRLRQDAKQLQPVDF